MAVSNLQHHSLILIYTYATPAGAVAGWGNDRRLLSLPFSDAL
jgi:hypothetical protein